MLPMQFTTVLGPRWVWILAFGISGLMAQNSFSLQQALQHAEKHNPNLANAQTDVDISKARINENIATGLPQINGGISYNYNIQTPVFIFPDFINGNPDQFTTIPAAPLNNMVMSASASMLVFNGTYLVGIQAAKEYLKLTTQQRELAARNIREDVTRAYYMSLIAKESVTTLDSAVQILSRTLRETEALYKAGFAEELDVEQLSLALSQNQDLLVQAKNGEKLALTSLKYIMGLPLETPIELTDQLFQLISAQNFSHLVQGLRDTTDVSQLTEVRLLTHQLNLMEYQVKLKKSQAMPSLATSLSYQYNLFNNERWLFLNGTQNARGGLVWGFNLQVPIFSSLNRHYQVQQAKLDRLKVERNLSYATQGLQVGYINAKMQVQDAYQRYLNGSKGFELATKIRRINGIKFREGLISSLNLTQAEQQYFEAQQRYFQAIYDLLVAKLALDKATQKL
jgi:outer membrane protein TolC